MKEKFEKWRDGLTYEQIVKMMWIAGVIGVLGFAIGIYILFHVPHLTVLYFIVPLYGGLIGEYEFWLYCQYDDKSIERDQKQLWEKYKEKLSENEFTEVFFYAPKYRSFQGELLEYYVEMRKCESPAWFAKLQAKEINVELRDGENVVKKIKISNPLFFDLNFKFSASEAE